MLKKIDAALIESALKKARASERKRFLHCIHNTEDRLQRQINAGLKDTYVIPHKHENPDKLEIFYIIKGKVAVLTFEDNGNIKEAVILDETGPIKAVEIPPKTWHNFVILSDEAALYELIDGHYDPKTHKKFAPFAPKEGDKEETKKYLNKLREEITQNTRKDLNMK